MRLYYTVVTVLVCLFCFLSLPVPDIFGFGSNTNYRTRARLCQRHCDTTSHFCRLQHHHHHDHHHHCHHNHCTDLDETLTSLDTELLDLVEQAETAATLPRSRNAPRSQSFRHAPASARPQSLTGLFMTRAAVDKYNKRSCCIAFVLE